MQVINPEVFYKYLITNEDFNNDLSLSAKNTYLDDNGKIFNHFDLDISNQSGEWLENQMNTMNEDKDDSEVTYGNFKYLSTIVSEDALFPVYMELFSLQLICMEKDRDRIIKFFDEYTTALNNYQDELSLEDDNGKVKNYDILIQLGELSTPEYGDKQDIGGCERFILDVSFSITVSSEIITTKKIKLYHAIDSDDISIPYVDLQLSRNNDLNVDNRADFEKKYEVNKSDFSIVISAVYTNNTFSNQVMDYLVDPSNAGNTLLIHYVDESSGVKQVINGVSIYNREYTFDCCFGDVTAKYSFGQPVSYTVSLRPRIQL